MTYGRRQETWDNIMSGKFGHRDWFDYAPAEERLRTAEIAMRGPQNPTERRKIYATLCPMGFYRHTPRQVAERLPIWC